MVTHYKLATGVIDELYGVRGRIIEGGSMDVETLHPVGLAALIFACDPKDLADEGDEAASKALALGVKRGGAFGAVAGVQAVVREIGARHGWDESDCSLCAMVKSMQILRQGGISHERCSICAEDIALLRVVVVRAGARSYREDGLDWYIQRWIDRAIEAIVERFESRAVRAQRGVIARREARKTEAALAKMREASFRLSDAPSLEARIAALEARLAEADALIAALRAPSAAAVDALTEGFVAEGDPLDALAAAD